MLIWAPAEAEDEDDVHAFVFDRMPMPIDEFRTLCGIRSNMNLVKLERGRILCEICQHRERSYEERNQA